MVASINGRDGKVNEARAGCMTLPLVVDFSNPASADKVNRLCDLALASYGGQVVVIRYLCREPAWKRLTTDECVYFAQAHESLSKQGGYFLLGLVHEYGADPGNAVTGRLDGAYCQQQLEKIGVPANAWIAAAVDEDVDDANTENRLIDYMHAFFAEMPGRTRACYGPGSILELALEVGAISVDGPWLTESTGFTDFQKFLDSGKCALWQMKEVGIAGLDTDTNLFNSRYTSDLTWTPAKIGFFVPGLSSTSGEQHQHHRRRHRRLHPSVA